MKKAGPKGPVFLFAKYELHYILHILSLVNCPLDIVKIKESNEPAAFPFKINDSEA
jgi:hypothetical protein